ncbi:unnamed protein product [Trichobilharzia szidati]|nr:unnamed protein product [Trichobilharzia szidati]
MIPLRTKFDSYMKQQNANQEVAPLKKSIHLLDGAQEITVATQCTRDTTNHCTLVTANDPFAGSQCEPVLGILTYATRRLTNRSPNYCDCRNCTIHFFLLDNNWLTTPSKHHTVGIPKSTNTLTRDI